MTLQTFQITMDIPEGFEPTGEFRSPKVGEIAVGYWDETPTCVTCIRDGGFKKIILRKKWEAPSCIPNGCWVYECVQDWWFVSDKEPLPTTPLYYNAPIGAAAVCIENLAVLYGFEFVPPPVHKIQVKR